MRATMIHQYCKAVDSNSLKTPPPFASHLRSRCLRPPSAGLRPRWRDRRAGGRQPRPPRGGAGAAAEAHGGAHGRLLQVHPGAPKGRPKGRGSVGAWEEG